MLTAKSLKPLALSSLCELWLVQVSRLPLFLPEDLASPAHLVLQDEHLTYVLLHLSLESLNVRTAFHRLFKLPERRRCCSSFVNFDDGFHHALLSEYVDLRYSPTYVIIDSGCTRAMGSRTAIMRLVKACRRHKNSSKIDFSFEPSSSRFSFANG